MGWYHHIYLEHNVYHMLFYMIYVDRKHENECDALEKYVKNNLIYGKIDFIPLGFAKVILIFKKIKKQINILNIYSNYKENLFPSRILKRKRISKIKMVMMKIKKVIKKKNDNNIIFM